MNKNRDTNFLILEIKMENQINSIYLRRKNKIICNRELRGFIKTDRNYPITIMKNIECFGYTFSKELISILETFTIHSLTKFYINIIKDLKHLTGYKVNYKPMYPNFPQQVMDAFDSELYFNAIMHYFGDSIGERILPDYEKVERIPLIDNNKLKVINIGNFEEFDNIFTNLVGANTSLSEQDKEDIASYLSFYEYDIIKIMFPKDIPYKENLVYITKLTLNNFDQFELTKKYYKTAIDVLRLAVSLSNGDITLKENTKFFKFNKILRRFLLSLLENCNNIEEDLWRYKKQFIRLGEILHPGKYKQKFPKCYEAFDIIRNKKYKTFNSKVEEMLLLKDFRAISLLTNRPGEFARRLDKLLRDSNDKISEIIIDYFHNFPHFWGTMPPI